MEFFNLDLGCEMAMNGTRGLNLQNKAGALYTKADEARAAGKGAKATRLENRADRMWDRAK